MAAFLSNLPSFNKDNFSRFQPNSNKYQQRKQSFMTLNKDYNDEQIIVNQRCNLIIQYLERQNRDKMIQTLNESERGKKREINEVTKKRAQTNNNVFSAAELPSSNEFNSKFLKKRRISASPNSTNNSGGSHHETTHQIQHVTVNSSLSQSLSAASLSYEDLIDIDDLTVN